jgi:hypothetical protein
MVTVRGLFGDALIHEVPDRPPADRAGRRGRKGRSDRARNRASREDRPDARYGERDRPGKNAQRETGRPALHRARRHVARAGRGDAG